MDKKELNWGETPFDRMSHEELMLHAKRMYMALGSAYNSLNQFRHMALHHNPNDRYWTGVGSGNEAYNRVEQAWTKAQDGFGDEATSRAYFRYAGNLLFDDYPGKELNRDHWAICTGCSELAGRDREHIQQQIGKKHKDIQPHSNCEGHCRLMTLDDLKPE